MLCYFNSFPFRYSDCAVVEPLPEALDDMISKKLWDVSVSLVGLQPSEIHEKLM